MKDNSSNSLHGLFLQHAKELTGFIRQRFPGEQDVADIVQETFLRLSQYPHPETIKNPRAFLFTTAANLTVDRYRRLDTLARYNVDDAELDEFMSPALSPEQFWQTQQQLEQFVTWLDELPELVRHAFVLYRIEGFSHAEIARRLGISKRCSERYVMQGMQHVSAKLSSDPE